MKDIHYAYGVARIRANENKMLTSKDINALISQESYSDAIRFLVRCGYASDGESFDDMIKRQSNDLYSLLIDCVPVKDEIDSLFLLNDYFNLKMIVKCAVNSEKPKPYFVCPTTIKCDAFNEIAEEKLFPLLGEKYCTVAERAYKAALLSKNGMISDMIVDRAAIDELSTIAKQKHKTLFSQLAGFQGDVANIKIALRCVATNKESEFIEEAIGGCNKLDRVKLINAAANGYDSLVGYLLTTEYKNGVEFYQKNSAVFEKWCDDTLIDFTSEAIYTSFGSDPIISYYYRKSLEIKTVRMIINALKSDIDKNVIKERVREIYA